MNYERFLRGSSKLGRNRLAVVPSSLFPQVRKQPWITIGVPNVYRGYAIIGREQPGLEPVRSAEDSGLGSTSFHHVSHAESKKRLRKLGRAMSEPSAKIKAFEEKSQLFAQHVLKLAGCSRRKDIKVIAPQIHRYNTVRDPMFTALVEKEADFALGPAPSRALAQQAGFVVYADYKDVHELTPPRDRPGLEALSMHENWVVDIPAHERSTLLRLAAVLFYTVEYIRLNREDFIQFLYNQVQAALDEGAYSIQRDFIRAAVCACYTYVSVHDYPFAYLEPQGPYYYGSANDSGLGAVYSEWMHYRGECDRLIEAVCARPENTWTGRAKSVFQRAKLHYRIFNFFDAYEHLLRTEELLEER